MGVREVTPLIRNPIRVKGSLVIVKSWSVNLNEWGAGSNVTNKKLNLG